MAFGGLCLFGGEHVQYLSCTRYSGIDFQVVEQQAVPLEGIRRKGHQLGKETETQATPIEKNRTRKHLWIRPLKLDY